MIPRREYWQAGRYQGKIAFWEKRSMLLIQDPQAESLLLLQVNGIAQPANSTTKYNDYCRTCGKCTETQKVQGLGTRVVH
jgi:hypothetical protein